MSFLFYRWKVVKLCKIQYNINVTKKSNKSLAASTARQKGIGMDNLKRQAEKIASEMYNRGLQPWHVEGEIEVRAIPLMYRDRLKKMVTEQLEKLRSYQENTSHRKYIFGGPFLLYRKN